MAKQLKITTEHLRKADRKASRELELENKTGWAATHKVHKSKKNVLHRKRKHRGERF
jgi:hypothetical protein